MRVFFLIIIGVFLGMWFWFGKEDSSIPSQPFENQTGVVQSEGPDEASKTESVPELAPPLLLEKPVVRDVRYSVPFTSQAPTGDWSKSVFQDGCEEASTLMVWMAREGKKLTREEVKAKLIEMATFETKRIGHGVDTDAVTTRDLLLDQYFGITDADLRVYDFTLEELKLALQDGLVIVPTNGRALDNPNFTAPGPLQHMLVITGYDLAKKEFITNDPGTRKGEGYRYPEQVLYDAIREYPTGKHLPITTERRVMIVVPFETKD